MIVLNFKNACISTGVTHNTHQSTCPLSTDTIIPGMLQYNGHHSNRHVTPIEGRSASGQAIHWPHNGRGSTQQSSPAPTPEPSNVGGLYSRGTPRVHFRGGLCSVWAPLWTDCTLCCPCVEGCAPPCCDNQQVGQWHTNHRLKDLGDKRWMGVK